MLYEVITAYIMILSGGRWSIPFALLFFCGVAFRLIRFVVVDKKRTDRNNFV